MKENLNNALQRRAEEINAQAEFIMAKTHDWQVIKQYMSNRTNDLALTDEQQKKLERYQFIYNELVSGKSTDQQVVMQVKNFFKVSQSQAYEDMNASKEVFSSVVSLNRLFEINLALQLNKKYMAKAEEMSDMKALAAFEKNRKDLLKLLAEANENPAEFFEGHTYEMVFDPKLLGAPKVDMKELLAAINAKRAKPINLDMFEELDNEEIVSDGSNT